MKNEKIFFSIDNNMILIENLFLIHIYQTLNSDVLVALLKRLVSSVAVGINEIQLKVKDRMLCYGGWLVVRKNMRNVKTCPIEWW